jgi:hypothetical protein
MESWWKAEAARDNATAWTISKQSSSTNPRPHAKCGGRNAPRARCSRTTATIDYDTFPDYLEQVLMWEAMYFPSNAPTWGVFLTSHKVITEVQKQAALLKNLKSSQQQARQAS